MLHADKMCPADIESATLIQWFMRAAPNGAAAYNHAGNDYIAYADHRISTLLDTKLTDLRVPARFVFSTRVAVREPGYGVSWVEPCERWTSSFPMNSSGSRRPTLQVADSWNAPPLLLVAHRQQTVLPSLWRRETDAARDQGDAMATIPA